MQLGLVEALVVTLYHRHPLTEQPQSPFRLPDPAVGFRDQREKSRLPKTRAGGPQVGQALAHLRASFFVAALLDQCPAAQNRPHGHEQWKALFGTDRDSLLGMLARGPRLLSKLVQPGRKDQRQREAVVVRQIARQREGLTASVETLLSMAEMPQC